MRLLNRRPPVDPATAAALAAARAAETRADVDRARALAELKREQAAAERTAAVEAERVARAAKRERDAERRAERAERAARRVTALRRTTGRVRLLVPLLIVNGAAVYGQVAYAYARIAPAKWDTVARLALAVLFAAAVESIAVYVGWHAHDALLAKATATAARLRRASYLIAAVVASINYAHFADRHMAPTAAAVAFGLLSLLSPWLWGLHTRRVQHVQLVDEGAVDCTGATFSVERARAFPFRTWAARRWSIDHNVTDPAEAWAGYNAERDARRAARVVRVRRRRGRAVRGLAHPGNRLTLAWAALRGSLPAPAALEVRPSVVEVDGPADPWSYATPIGDQAATDTASVADAAPAIESATPVDTEPATTPARKPPAAPPRTRTPAAKKTASKPANDTASKVAKWAAKMPDATHAEIAAKAGVSVRSVERYRPAKESATQPASAADTTPVNGHAVYLTTI